MHANHKNIPIELQGKLSVKRFMNYANDTVVCFYRSDSDDSRSRDVRRRRGVTGELADGMGLVGVSSAFVPCSRTILDPEKHRSKQLD